VNERAPAAETRAVPAAISASANEVAISVHFGSKSDQSKLRSGAYRQPTSILGINVWQARSSRSEAGRRNIARARMDRHAVAVQEDGNSYQRKRIRRFSELFTGLLVLKQPRNVHTSSPGHVHEYA
jgi:hypothetical protein